MEINTMLVKQNPTAFTVNDLITLANNVCNASNFGASTDSNAHTFELDILVDGVTLPGNEVVGGDNATIPHVKPQFYPKAVAGKMCIAAVSALAWADENLTTYEYLKFNKTTSGNAAWYLVHGVHAVTADESYNPFSGGTGSTKDSRIENGTGSTPLYATYDSIGGQMFD